MSSDVVKAYSKHRARALQQSLEIGSEGKLDYFTRLLMAVDRSQFARMFN
jgi:hypothetical protein